MTSTYNWETERYEEIPARDREAALQALRDIRAEGVFVTATDDTADGGSSVSRRSTANACGAGARSYVADIELTQLPAAPITCP